MLLDYCGSAPEPHVCRTPNVMSAFAAAIEGKADITALLTPCPLLRVERTLQTDIQNLLGSVVYIQFSTRKFFVYSLVSLTREYFG